MSYRVALPCFDIELSLTHPIASCESGYGFEHKNGCNLGSRRLKLLAAFLVKKLLVVSLVLLLLVTINLVEWRISVVNVGCIYPSLSLTSLQVRIVCFQKHVICCCTVQLDTIYCCKG